MLAFHQSLPDIPSYSHLHEISPFSMVLKSQDSVTMLWLMLHHWSYLSMAGHITVFSDLWIALKKYSAAEFWRVASLASLQMLKLPSFPNEKSLGPHKHLGLIHYGIPNSSLGSRTPGFGIFHCHDDQSGKQLHVEVETYSGNRI